MSSAVVFISYAREDEQTARSVFADLERAGFSPWLDRERLLPGSTWESEIPKAIKSCDFFIALISSTSLNKDGYVQRELEYALAVVDELPTGQTFVIPARLDDCKPQDPRLGQATWIDLFPSRVDGMPRLTRAMRLHATGVPSAEEARLALLQVKLEAFWSDGGARVLNLLAARARIGELLSGKPSEEIVARLQSLFANRDSLQAPPVAFARFSADSKLVIAEYWNSLGIIWAEDTARLIDIGALVLTNRLASAGGSQVLYPVRFDALVYAGAPDPVGLVRDMVRYDGAADAVRLVGHTAPIRVCAFSPDGTRIVTGAQDGTARLWNTSTGEELMVMSGHSGWVTAVAISPDGAHVVTAAEPDTTIAEPDTTIRDPRIRLWDTRNKRLKTMLRGHADGTFVNDLSFSPAGDRLVSAASNGEACLWDCDYWARVANLRGHATLVTSARFSPDGSKMVTASLDGRVVVWPVFSRLEALNEAAGRLRD